MKNRELTENERKVVRFINEEAEFYRTQKEVVDVYFPLAMQLLADCWKGREKGWTQTELAEAAEEFLEEMLVQRAKIMNIDKIMNIEDGQ